MSILKVKHILFGSILLLSVDVAMSKNLGDVGETLPIIEQNLLEVIMNKLNIMHSAGELGQHQYYIQNKMRGQILQPKENKLPETVKQREFLYDPTITVDRDLEDGKGNIFRRKGERINPLDTYNFRVPWLFFDSNSLKQKQFALIRAKREQIKLILTAGKPLDLMKESELPIYFDQQGLLAKKFNIKQVPALVEQQDKKLKITEIEMSK